MIQIRDQYGQATVDERELARTLGAWNPGASSTRRTQFKDLQRDLVAGRDTARLQSELGVKITVLKSRLGGANIAGSPRWFGAHASGEESSGSAWFGRHRAREGAESTSEAAAHGRHAQAPEGQVREPVMAPGGGPLPKRQPFITGPAPLPKPKPAPKPAVRPAQPPVQTHPDAPALPKRKRGSNEPKRPSFWNWFRE